MYVGFAVGWIGLWIVFGHANLLAIAAVAGVALGVHLFIILYEEPTLRRKFGAEYEAYCRNVSRWWPSLEGLGQGRVAPLLQSTRVSQLSLVAVPAAFSLVRSPY